ncbi:MAG: hypothetical protein AB7E72_14735 [Lysobacterales bacterium]
MYHRVIILLAGAALALAGCASTGSYTTKNTRYGPPPLENDMAYVYAVETAAKRQGVDVHWVHPPRKVAQSDGQ